MEPATGSSLVVCSTSWRTAEFGPRDEAVAVFVRPGPTDMRKAINWLATLVD